jgi:tRNA(Arg) A34 adenosine deaminase TadA
MLSRRTFGSLIGSAACVGGAAAGSASVPTFDLDAISLAAHEAGMRLAIGAAKANPFYPFGAVIIGAADRAVLAQGVNNSKTNPILHGEIVAINDYVARHRNRGWADGILYTTGEPCPMCMGAIVWAGIGGVVYGTSISILAEAGIAQITIDASAVRDAAPFYRGQIMGGVLRAETDALFRHRQRVGGVPERGVPG